MRLPHHSLGTALCLLIQTRLVLAILSSNPGDFNVIPCGDKKGKTPECTVTFSNREAQFVQQWGYRLRLFLRRNRPTPSSREEGLESEENNDAESATSRVGIGHGISGMGKLAWDWDWDEKGSSGLLVQPSSLSTEYDSDIGVGIADEGGEGWKERLSGWYGSRTTEWTEQSKDRGMVLSLGSGAGVDDIDDFYYPSLDDLSDFKIEDEAHYQQRIMERALMSAYGSIERQSQIPTTREPGLKHRENDTTDDVRSVQLELDGSDKRRSRIRLGRRYIPVPVGGRYQPLIA